MEKTYKAIAQEIGGIVGQLTFAKDFPITEGILAWQDLSN